MEITKTFVNTFDHMMRAKLRWFFRRSLRRYAIAVALITYALHADDPALTTMGIVTRGFAYFLALCVGVLGLHVVLAYLQSRKVAQRTITFTEQNLIVDHKGQSSTRDWDWIISADESTTLISLLVRRMPRLELYMPKTKLDDNEYAVLHGWLVSHGKLPPIDKVA
jgi:hypothetical protein